MSKKKKSRSGLRLNVVTSCISTTLVLVLLGAVVFFVTTATHLSDMLRENFTVSVMLDDDIPNNEANKLQQQLRRLPCAASVSYISKERAAAEQIKAMGCDPSEFLGSNPIPASFEIHLKADYTTSDSLETIIPGLKEQKYVMDVDYPKELVESINSNIRKISIILLAVALLLTFVSFVLINNTMRLSIYARRFSIRTMQLVGAKPSFIRRPFMSNAFWVGFISAMFACALLVFGIDSLVRFDPSMAKVVTWEIVAITMGTVFGCGIILILLCAYFSVNKYLRMRADDIYRA